MTRLNERKLRRLARLTELVYRREAVAAVELAQSQHVLAAGVQDACAMMDGADNHPFLRQLALARAARLSGMAEASRRDLDAQLAIAVEALARFKGAEAIAEGSAEANARSTAQRALEEAIGSCGAPARQGLSKGDVVDG